MAPGRIVLGPAEEAKEFSENTSMHGVRVIGDKRASSTRRLFWGMLVVSNAAFVVYQGVTLLLRLLNPGIQTSIQLVNQRGPLNYPAVTICNHNNYRLSYLQENPDLITHLLSKWGQIPTSNRAYASNSTSRLTEAAHQVDRMVLFCLAERQFYKDCWKKFKLTKTDFGICYTFNWNESSVASAPLPGQDYAIYIPLRTEKKEYFYSEFMTATEGFKVLVHRPQVEPQVNMFGFSISPGEQTQVSLHKNRVIYDKGMDCYDTKHPGFVNPLQYYDTYSSQACLVECRAKYIEEQCNCRYSFSPGSKEGCETHETFLCMHSAVVNYTKVASTCYCPEECDRVYFDTKLSTARYPSNFYIGLFANMTNLTYDEVSDELALLTIFFEDAAETVTEQRFDYDFSSFWSDLGGLMGMALGASVLTCCELIEFIWIFGFSLCNLSGTRTRKVLVEQERKDGKHTEKH